jgi:hypothetical protein
MTAAPDVAYHLAEWYRPELSEQTVDDIVARLDSAAAAMSVGGTRVRLRLTLSVPTDEVLYGVFEAGSVDVVSQTCEHAGVPPQRLTSDVGTRIQHDCFGTVIVDRYTTGLKPTSP